MRKAYIWYDNEGSLAVTCPHCEQVRSGWELREAARTGEVQCCRACQGEFKVEHDEVVDYGVD